MATTKVAPAQMAHDGQAVGWRAGDHTRSGSRTTVDLIGYGRAILPIRPRLRQRGISALTAAPVARFAVRPNPDVRADPSRVLVFRGDRLARRKWDDRDLG